VAVRKVGLGEFGTDRRRRPPTRKLNVRHVNSRLSACCGQPTGPAPDRS
jgi:hypothetical protein